MDGTGQRKTYTCVVCKDQRLQSRVFTTSRSLKRHVFGVHQYSKNFKVKCGVNGCSAFATKLRLLNKHLREVHNKAEWTPSYATVFYDNEDNIPELVQVSPTPTGNLEIGAVHENAAAEHEDDPVGQVCMHDQEYTDREMVPNLHVNVPEQNEDDDDYAVMYNMELEKTNFQRRKEMCLSLARLRAQNSMTEVCFERVKCWASGLLTNLAQVMIGGVQKINSQHSGHMDEVTELGLGLANPFHGLSEHTFLKVLKDDLGYISPETVVLLEVPTASGQERHTMQYIPLLGVVNSLLKDDGFKQQLTSHRMSSPGYLQDFCDGEYAQTHPLFQDSLGSLQLQLYYDDFEVVNPLGSKTSVHKMGALYYSFMNLCPSRRGSLDNIYLLALFYVEDLKNSEIGWKKILHRFNDELHLLETGIHSDHVDDIPITGTIAQLSADNLAAHSILGFDEKFSGESVHVSRYCLCTRLEIQEKFHESECVIRTRELYDADLATALATGESVHGVKGVCHLNSMYFHPAENYSADAHHDVLEGVIPQTLKPILKVYIKKKHYFTLRTLNDRLLAFNYNAQDSKNKPSLIKETKLTDDTRTLRQNASQYWCLLRKLSLIIGDLIPEDDPHWQLLLCLIGIVDIVLSPRIQEDVLPYLQTEICDFLRLYKQLFPELTITPKMHYMLHYPRLIKLIGPLSRHWVMRFEGKHKLLKKTMDITGNFINSAYTMAKRHQMQQVVSFHDNPTFGRTEISNEQLISLDTFEQADILVAAGVPNEVTMVQKATVLGTVYRKGQVLWIGWTDQGFEEFGEVCHILVYPEDGETVVRFVVSTLFNMEFCEHFHAWQCCYYIPPLYKTICVSELVDFNPVGKHLSFEKGRSGRYYINCKYRIDADFN